jgi:hypothetical protein
MRGFITHRGLTIITSFSCESASAPGFIDEAPIFQVRATATRHAVHRLIQWQPDPESATSSAAEAEPSDQSHGSYRKTYATCG